MEPQAQGPRSFFLKSIYLDSLHPLTLYVTSLGHTLARLPLEQTLEGLYGLVFRILRLTSSPERRTDVIVIIVPTMPMMKRRLTVEEPSAQHHTTLCSQCQNSGLLTHNSGLHLCHDTVQNSVVH